MFFKQQCVFYQGKTYFCNVTVMALFPQTTCFYKAVVNQLPQICTDDYELLFEDSTYPDGFAPPLNVPQRYVIDIRDKRDKTHHSSWHQEPLSQLLAITWLLSTDPQTFFNLQ